MKIIELIIVMFIVIFRGGYFVIKGLINKLKTYGK